MPTAVLPAVWRARMATVFGLSAAAQGINSSPPWAELLPAWSAYRYRRHVLLAFSTINFTAALHQVLSVFIQLALVCRQLAARSAPIYRAHLPTILPMRLSCST